MGSGAQMRFKLARAHLLGRQVLSFESFTPMQSTSATVPGLVVVSEEVFLKGVDTAQLRHQPNSRLHLLCQRKSPTIG